MSDKTSLSFAVLYPVNQDAASADPKTREFLLRVVQILLDFVSKTNDRDEKVSLERGEGRVSTKVGTDTDSCLIQGGAGEMQHSGEVIQYFIGLEDFQNESSFNEKGRIQKKSFWHFCFHPLTIQLRRQ